MQVHPRGACGTWHLGRGALDYYNYICIKVASQLPARKHIPIMTYPLLDYYEGRSIVIVGESGLSGTALTYKLVTCTKVSHIYIVVRGGEECVPISLIVRTNMHHADK